jgi:DNA-binding PucR family transcriptional regulator
METAVSESADSAAATLGFLLGALGSTVVSLQVAPAGTHIPVRSVALLDADDLAAAEPGARVADLCVLAGVSADAAIGWLEWLAGDQSAEIQSAETQPAEPQSAESQSALPVAVVIKDGSADLCRSAEAAGVAVGVLHAQARAELVLSTVRSLLDGAAARPQPDSPAGEAFAEESDLYGLAQRVAALCGGLVSIEDDQSRLLAYSATDGAADELRMLSILGREGPAEHLRRLRELGVFDRLRKSSAVVDVPADPDRGWHRRLVVSIQPIGRSNGRGGPGAPLGTIWIQEGWQPLARDTESLLEGAAAIAARLIHRARNAPTQEALQIQRLLGIRGGGVDVPSLVSALALPTSGPSAVVGIGVAGDSPVSAPVAEIAAALRLLSGAYARESLVTSTDERMYVLIPQAGSSGLPAWVRAVLDRLTARFATPLRAAIAAPVESLGDVPAARAEVDRVLDRPAGTERVTTLTQSRTPVLLGEIAELIGSRPELRDPRLQTLIDYDRDRDASLVETTAQYLLRFGDVRGAADELHIHPNTLRYRLRRAEELLGMSLDEPETRLLLQIQLLVKRWSA